jgi:hypothetical protein
MAVPDRVHAIAGVRLRTAHPLRDRPSCKISQATTTSRTADRPVGVCGGVRPQLPVNKRPPTIHDARALTRRAGWRLGPECVQFMIAVHVTLDKDGGEWDGNAPACLVMGAERVEGRYMMQRVPRVAVLTPCNLTLFPADGDREG